MKSFDSVRPGSSGTKGTTSHHPKNAPGKSGSSADSANHSAPSLQEMHIRTHLKKTLIEMFGEGDCDQDQVGAMFERYGLHEL